MLVVPAVPKLTLGAGAPTTEYPTFPAEILVAAPFKVTFWALVLTVFVVPKVAPPV